MYSVSTASIFQITWQVIKWIQINMTVIEQEQQQEPETEATTNHSFM